MMGCCTNISAINFNDFIPHMQDSVPTSGSLLWNLRDKYAFVIILIWCGTTASGNIDSQSLCVSMYCVFNLRQKKSKVGFGTKYRCLTLLCIGLLKWEKVYFQPQKYHAVWSFAFKLWLNPFQVEMFWSLPLVLQVQLTLKKLVLRPI